MNGFLVSVWGQDLIPVRLFETRADAERFVSHLTSYYWPSPSVDHDVPWEGVWANHHPDVKEADLCSIGEVGFEMVNMSITEFRDGRPVK